MEKQTKATQYQEEKEIKAFEEHGKQLTQFNEFIKNDFNINSDDMPLKK